MLLSREIRIHRQTSWRAGPFMHIGIRGREGPARIIAVVSKHASHRPGPSSFCKRSRLRAVCPVGACRVVVCCQSRGSPLLSRAPVRERVGVDWGPWPSEPGHHTTQLLNCSLRNPRPSGRHGGGPHGCDAVGPFVCRGWPRRRPHLHIVPCVSRLALIWTVHLPSRVQPDGTTAGRFIDP